LSERAIVSATFLPIARPATFFLRWPIAHILHHSQEGTLRPVKPEMNFLASLVGKPVRKRIIEKGATYLLSKTVGSALISDFLKSHSRVQLNTRYFIVLTKLKFDRKLVKICQKKVYLLKALRIFKQQNWNCSQQILRLTNKI
jgi:hypothetical protein